MYCINAPAPKQNGTPANAAVVCAHFPPPNSSAIIPTNSNASACTSAAKNRNPPSDVPNNFNASHAKNAVIGGYCTYPQARCPASSNAINSSPSNPYRHPTARCTSTVATAIPATAAIPLFHHWRLSSNVASACDVFSTSFPLLAFFPCFLVVLASFLPCLIACS